MIFVIFYVNSRVQTLFLIRYMRFISILLLTFLLCACNSDIFVEDFTPDVTELTMSGGGASRTIRFRSDDWSQLTFAGVDINSSGLQTVVTPAGGSPMPGKTLTGDGTISLHTSLNDLVVTRRGDVVTVDVSYAIGNGELMFWLVASSDETYDRHEIMIEIERVEGLEIVDVDYNLMSWSVDDKIENRLLAAYALVADREPVLWTPSLPSGMLSFYNIYTVSEDDEYLSALEGEEIPVPTRTNPYYSDWKLRGETVEISSWASYTHLLHYPPLPQVNVLPGTLTQLFVEMVPTTFDARLRVRNKFSGEVHEMIIWLSIEQPDSYEVKYDEL